MLSDKQFNEIHEASVQILNDVGFHIPDDDLLEKIQGAGLTVDFSNQAVKFAESDIDNALQHVPKEIKLYNRDTKKELVLGSETLFMPSGTGIFLLDRVTGKRKESTSDDIKELLQLQEKLDQVDIARPMVTANDFGDHADLIESYLCMRHTHKPFLHRVLHPEKVDAFLEMARAVAGGKQALKENPFFFVVYCPKSPLSMAPENIRCALAFAEAGVPVLVLSMAMGGATAPVTLAGEALMINTEVLAGIVVIQTLFPGTPVLYGSVSSVLDMKTGILALGAPERGILNGLCAELANRYQIPSVMGGLSTDAKQHDEQAGAEKIATCLPLMGKASVVFGMGNMDSAGTYSCEQLVIDNELASYIRTIHGIPPQDNIAKELAMIKEIGFKGDHLTHPHTLSNCRSYWQPESMSRLSYTSWENEKKSLITHVNQRIDQILKNSEASLLSQEIDSELERILVKNGVKI
jgi:trimethylamine---corrinoid protein Co-methyltransferase